MNIFILGVNGISMRSIEKTMKEQGHNVLGYDDSPIELKNINYSKTIYEKKHIKQANEKVTAAKMDLIVYSSAIKKNHPLMIEAKKLKIPTIGRTDFFVKYMPLNNTKILIAGAHGKTTTSSLLAYILNSSYYLGGIINGEESPSKFKESQYTVIETDESDGSFLKWQGEYKLLLNFDYEHMIFYKTKENIIKYHREFVMNNIETTKVIINEEAKNKLEIKDHPNIITFGNKNANYNLSNIKANETGITFEINNKQFSLPILGKHNASNFIAIYALLNSMNLNLNGSIKKTQSFPGVKKRMQKIKYRNHNLKFFLDYGHHPNEIKSVLESLKEHYPNEKFEIIFEAHKPSRIIENKEKWPEIFKGFKIWLYPIYIADEKEINEQKYKMTTEIFAKNLKENEINLEVLKEDLSNLELNKNNLICFSAGKLSEKLSKY
ncbi:Mur ligase family protein [Alphaproteobacteria bacterium endosymbiont of Tiliacea citrago]|uniref:Mur ligase family protein n=1 Tax=Alphaproteobacteria bacterium endosymbiont of Tiliacea citrago TaxID=3077944 RepID=UPI00313B32E4